MPFNSTAAAELAARCARPGDTLVRVDLIEPLPRAYRPGSIRRAGGAPIGVDEHTRPRWRDGFMAHLITVDLDDVPQLRVPGVRALALFISNATDNEAFQAGTPETELVRLTDADLAKGEWTGPAVQDPPARAYRLHPLDVPARAFYDVFDPTFDEDAVDPGLDDLHDLLVSADRIGGPVLHWSGDTYTKDFLWQFSEAVVDVNLGDAGTMYVYAATAYWNCH
ncbi:hypothetical protein OHA72_54170 [Dactylosporangium sp. NBC_01737]|uniref:hypothetical protein n=1 Tax=Dactylosporangium sp. NBC_01737 TaxID=2975959 RepID=UPI002E0E3AAD|nr:hypothetical protein OHA72_54170 [Dactylosporangium sp. NBC_01737]